MKAIFRTRGAADEGKWKRRAERYKAERDQLREAVAPARDALRAWQEGEEMDSLLPMHEFALAQPDTALAPPRRRALLRDL